MSSWLETLTSPGQTTVDRLERGRRSLRTTANSAILYLRLARVPAAALRFTYPTASILYISHASAYYADGDMLFFIGTGQGNGHVGAGIVGYRGESSIDGVLSTGQVLSRPVTDLSVGLHTLTFSVMDDESNWVSAGPVTLFVAETPCNQYLPLSLRDQ